ncbi:MAG: GDSL-type esterase/lipase family protein [Deltaproteobacteria bacterium]
MSASSSIAGRVTRVVLGGLLLASLALAAHALRMQSADPAWSDKLLTWGGVASVAFAVMLVLPTNLRINLTLSLVMAGLCAFVFNLYLAYTPPPVVRKAEAILDKRKSTPGFDLRSPLDVVRDLRKDGVQAVPALFGINAVDDPKRPDGLLPLIGISTATTVLCNEVGEFAIFTADEHGHRNPVIPERADVVLVGDSFMQGQCVGPGKDIAGLLRARGFTVYNLGSSGNGPVLNLAALLEYGLAKKPKVVLWGYAGNDPGDLRHELLNPRLRQYLEDPDTLQNLVDRQDEIDTYWRANLDRQNYLEPKPKKETKWEPRAPTFTELVTLYQLRRLLGLRRAKQGAWKDSFRRALTLARERVRAGGGEMYFVPFPYFEYVTSKPDTPRAIFEIVAPTGVPTVDLDRPFLDHADPESLFPLRMPGHFSEAGYAFVAERLAASALKGITPSGATEGVPTGDNLP